MLFALTSAFDYQVLFLTFTEAQFTAGGKIGGRDFFVDRLYLPVVDVYSALFNKAFGLGHGLR